MSEPIQSREDSRERPILFSGPMVRALLAGTKSQTRRAFKRHLDPCEGHAPNWRNHAPDGWWCAQCGNGVWHRDWRGIACPYGVPGEVLWVRETWTHADTRNGFAYCANTPLGSNQRGMGWRPSIHMPRAACRVRLRITDVRLERLNDISERDAIAEGIRRDANTRSWCGAEFGRVGNATRLYASPVRAYADLWEHINGPGSWAANPWIWAVSFEVMGRP